MMFRQEISREGSARLKVAGMPTAYIFLARAGSAVSRPKRRRMGIIPAA